MTTARRPRPSIQPWHMKGWEAFGCIENGQPQDPTVRRLGIGHHTSRPQYGTERWGPGEVDRGLGGIEVHLSADDETGAFVYVVGTTERGVRRGWGRVTEMVVNGLAEVWR